MEFYKLEKRIDRYEIDENKFLDFLREYYKGHPFGEDIESINTFQELISLWGCLDEFEEPLNAFLKGYPYINEDEINYYFEDYENACRNY